MWQTWTSIAYVLFGSAAAYSIARAGLTGWYKRITLPSGTPTTAVLTWLWIICFALYGMSLFAFLNGGINELMANHTYYWLGITAYGAVGLLGILWSYVFFTYHRVMFSIYISGLMAVMILSTAVILMQLNTTASFLAIIYFIWISYICRVSYKIWELNP